MSNFIVRDMLTGELVGEAFGAGRFQWHGLNAFCDVPRHKLPLYGGKDGQQIVQMVYEIEDQAPTGSGEVVTYGAPIYNAGTDKVTRTVTLSDPVLTGAAKTAAVNAEADRRLLAVYPQSEQIWGALRAAQLIHKKAVLGQALTAGETATLSAINTAMTFVDAIRTARLALIAGGDLTKVQIATHASWPASP